MMSSSHSIRKRLLLASLFNWGEKNWEYFGGVEFDRRIGQNLGRNEKLWVEN